MSTRSCAESGMVLMKYQTTDNTIVAVNKDLLLNRLTLHDFMVYFVIDGVFKR